MLKPQPANNASEADATLAFKLWRARFFRDGSPEEDLFRAVCSNSATVSVKSKSRTQRRVADSRLTGC